MGFVRNSNSLDVKCSKIPPILLLLGCFIAGVWMVGLTSQVLLSSHGSQSMLNIDFGGWTKDGNDDVEVSVTEAFGSLSGTCCFSTLA